MALISKLELSDLYLKKKYSVSSIASEFKCSQSKVNFWLKKYNIKKRSISDAIYMHHNRAGEPFSSIDFKRSETSFILGLGIGLYWGEGNKVNKHSIRLGNTDPDLIFNFIKFLKTIFKIKESKLRFGLQVFNDVNSDVAINFWKSKLNVNDNQFQKVVVSKVRGIGTYKNKSKYGVLTIYFNNKKLRNIIMNEIDKLRVL